MWLWFLLCLICGMNQLHEENYKKENPMPQIPDKDTECSDLYKQVVKNRIRNNSFF